MRDFSLLPYLTIVKKENPDKKLFEEINANKFGKHSANYIEKDTEGNVLAVKCNCGRKVYHPVLKAEKGKHKALWGISFSIEGIIEMKNGLCVKSLWASED